MNAVEVSALVMDYPVHRGLFQTLRRPFDAPTARILDGLDLTAGIGEVVGVLGANGAGKTTLLKILAGLVRPTAGQAVVAGKDVVRNEKELRGTVAYAFGDDRSFYWRLSGRQNLEFFAALSDLHGDAAAGEISDLAERFGIGPYLDEPYSFYSTGIRQRFTLVRALLRRPEVLLLDEPTRSVDQAHAKELWSLVRNVLVAERGMTVLVVTHQAEEAVAVCDRIAVLQEGRVQTDLRPDELRCAAQGLSGLVITLEGFRDAELTRLRAVRGVRDVVLSQNNGQQELEVWCENGDVELSELIAATTASGATVRSLAESAPVSEVVARLVAGGERR